MSEVSKLPWRVGTGAGFCADQITDANDLAVCSVYGVSLNTTVEKARNKWNCEGLANADYIVQAANAFPALCEALEKIRDLPGEINFNNYDDGDVHKLNSSFIEAYEIAVAALALAKGATK